jgi:hypothetical protein
MIVSILSVTVRESRFLHTVVRGGDARRLGRAAAAVSLLCLQVLASTVPHRLTS